MDEGEERRAVQTELAILQRAYRQTFDPDSPVVKAVLEDLAKFCRAHESCYAPDARDHAVAEGRREVWLRLQYMVQLTPEELWRFLGGK